MSQALEHRKPISARILDCFPSGVYALNALLGLLDIVETRDVETAAVECRAEPRMLVNPDFVDRRADTPEKLLMLVMHELHHILLGHTRFFPCVTAVDNLVFDAVINALLFRMFPAPEHTAFFTGFYDEKQFPACLLRPPAGWNPHSKTLLPKGLLAPRHQPVRDVYRALYSEKGASYEDLYDALRKLVSEDAATRVPLIGDHKGANGSAAGHLDARSPILFEAVREVVERWPQPPDPIAGRSLAELLKESSLRPVRQISNREALRKLLRQVGGERKSHGRTRVRDDDIILIDTPLPGFDRRSVVLASLGAQPLLYTQGVRIRRPVPGGEKVHVYLDVSGSIGDLKGPLYGAVLDCRESVYPRVHLFSTEVADITLEELRRGVCRTTGGTDISCVAAHMRKKRIRRAVIITDGYVGKPAGQDLETLKNARLGVALTPGNATQEDIKDVANWFVHLQNHQNQGGH
jgi:hypothetical protein